MSIESSTTVVVNEEFGDTCILYVEAPTTGFQLIASVKGWFDDPSAGASSVGLAGAAGMMENVQVSDQSPTKSKYVARTRQ